MNQAYNANNNKVRPSQQTLARREEIIRMVTDRGQVGVEELSELFAVSSVTIRNDLNHLNEKGLLIRSRGGAMACRTSVIELPVKEKQSQNQAIKTRIAEAATKFINDGDSIILDSGTTTQEVARQLYRHQQLVVMTNGLNVASELAAMSDVEMMMTGGHYRKKSMSFYGSQAEQSLAHLRFDKLILAVDGYDIEAGITTHFEHEANLNRLMCKVARKVIVVADSSKFNKRGYQVILPFDEIDILITDTGIPENYKTELEKKGVKLVLVEAS